MSNEQILSYLSFRGANDLVYQDYLLNDRASGRKFKLRTVEGFDYLVSHLLDKSTRIGYGLLPTNKILKTEETSYIAIGLIEGDDIICLSVLEGFICIWMIQTGSGEYIKIANNFEEFIITHTE